MAASHASFVDDLVRAALEGDRATFDRVFDLAFVALCRAAARRGTESVEAAAADWMRHAVAHRLAAYAIAAPPAAASAAVPEVGPTLGAR